MTLEITDIAEARLFLKQYNAYAKLTDAEKEAAYNGAMKYRRRQERAEHPTGHFDKAKRFYPDAAESPGGIIQRTIREPSRAWPFSYMIACRSLTHCCYLESADVKHARLVMKLHDIAIDETAESYAEFISQIEEASADALALTKPPKKA
ncbi:hypothetical protein QEG29_001160 [Stenotrophomonas maltophilia]|nr:hypothetical protein [Stenotrophomonas maltophilia]